MAIEKNCFKVSRLDSECSPRSRETMSSDEEELRGRNSAVESDDDDEFDEADSGAGSDDFDLLELGETGAEFCQIGNQTCSIPLELYDLAGLEDILSVDVWNECLSEEERFELAKYLPDMDQETFVQTLKELFTACNIHFGSPIKNLFDMLKGGLCEPRVALYREGLNFFQKRQHYHLLRKHQNNMVSNLCQIRDAWRNCRGYSIEERLRVLNIMRSQKSLMYEKMEDVEADSSDEESSEGIWSMKNKDKKFVQKMGHYPVHGVGSAQEFHPQGRSVVMEQEKYGKQNPKGMLKFAGSKAPSVKDPTGRISSVYHALDMNPGLNGSAPALSQRNKSVGYDSGSMLRLRDQLWNGGRNKEMSYGPSVHQDRNLLRSNQMDKSGVSRVGKRHDLLRAGGIDTDNLMGMSLSSKTDPHGYTRNANQSADLKMLTAKSSKRGSYEFSRKVKYPENVQQFVGNDQVKSRLRGSQLPLNINSVNSADYDELFYINETPGEEFGMDSAFKCDDWNPKGKKWKAGRESPDLSYTAFRSSSPQVSDRLLSSDFRAKSLQEKIRGNFMQNGGKDMALRGNQKLLRSEETESDSSEQLDDDEDNNPLLQGKYAYMMGTAAGSRAKSLKSHLDLKKDKFVTDLKPHVIKQSKKKGRFSEQGRMHSVDNYLSKVKQKGEISNGGPLHNLAGKFIEENYPSGSDMLNVGDDDWKLIDYKKSKNGRIRGEPFERSDIPSSNAYTAERKKKGRTGLDHSNLRSKYLHEYAGDEDDSLERQFSVDDNEVGQSRYGRKGPKYASYKGDQNERSEAPLLGCNSVMKKRKMKNDASDIGGRGEDANLLSNTRTNDSTYLKRKSKKKTEAELVNSEMENSELRIIDMRTADVEMETKPQKKSFTLITPTVHTGFSFSIIHLLSAVRMAMISPLTEDSLEMGKPSEQPNKAPEGSVNGALSNKMTASCEPADQLNLPSLTVQEIVNRVRSNPGDPNILETQEPLQDLVRGVLKIFSSKTAPLGAKGWKVLAVYERTTKSWSWTGPLIHNSSDQENVEEVTSPEAWGLPYKMLVKLVDSFANWLKCGQETLQQIGSLPAPPLALMQVNLDEKERFRDLRAQKSLNTISPSSEEVRAYFRKEEVLRYSIPDRAFSYTAADGKKSIVAPLRRCGGKPTSKARDHFMLKRDRPPHVTILCLVRDAAARLPGSIGTRADVCTLIRDSQYIVEDVSDAQINQVVSGALDRLHYERDPCVQFDGERKLWVYLHREREEEDFEDDGTSSTKKWKRQKKDAADPSDQGAADQGTVTVACHGTGEQSGHDLCSDLNVDPPCIDDDKGMELLSTDTRVNAEDHVDVNRASEEGNGCEGNSMAWEALDLNPTRELCQENSTNEDFDGESFGGERPVGLLSASLL